MWQMADAVVEKRKDPDSPSSSMTFDTLQLSSTSLAITDVVAAFCDLGVALRAMFGDQPMVDTVPTACSTLSSTSAEALWSARVASMSAAEVKDCSIRPTDSVMAGWLGDRCGAWAGTWFGGWVGSKLGSGGDQG